ncbi:MAG: hypothetical protein AAB309_04850, partial [Deltaproteobacteria bacterium]
NNKNHYSHIIVKLQEKEKYDEALEYAEKYLKLDPNDRMTIYSAAGLCKKIKNMECAEKYYDKLFAGNLVQDESLSLYAYDASLFFNEIQ